MCGINGILYLNSFDSDKSDSFLRDKVKLMNDEIIHRGPDDEGYLIDYPVSFGFRRLSIIDLSRNGNQPMFNEDKSIAIVFNGEIYNYLELIPDLKSKGHTFSTKTDTEVVIHSYEEYGFDCVNRFNGMWAFTIYDFRKKIFFASRDRFGVKPFYYFKNENFLAFSSEIKAILRITETRKANPGKVFDYLAYGYKTTNGDTFFEGINELLPAHNMVIQNNKTSISKYWDFSNGQSENNSYETILEQLIENSVELRFRSDVPVSILLSGGIDSSIIAKVTDELIENGNLQNKNVTAFSAVFPGFRFDESANIDEFVKTCRHIDHHKLTPQTVEFLDSAEQFVYGMGEPVFSATSFAHYTLMKEIKKNKIKVVLNGQGADESWFGYGRYIIGYFLLDLLLTNPLKFLSQMNSISNRMQYSYGRILSQTLKAMLSRKSVSQLRSKYIENTREVLSSDFINHNSDYFSNPVFKKFSGNCLHDYAKYNIQYQGFGQILHYEDHSSMQSSIEMRSPFLDYRIVELAFSMPSEEKFNNGVTKKILRDIFSDKLPESIIKNHNKIGFATPFDDWIKEEKFKKFIKGVINSESFNRKKIFNPEKIRKIFDSQQKYSGFPYWRFINLEVWSQVYGISNL